MPGFHAPDSKCRSVSHRSQPAWFVFVCAATVGITAPAMAQARVSVDRPDQLPAHVYRVSMPVSKLLSDDSAFARLVREVRENAEADLRTYDIRDRTTLGGYYSALESVALAQGRWEAALAYIDSARSVQDKAASRLLFGLLERPLIAAKRGDPATYRATYATALKRELDALPYDSVDAGLKSRRGGIDGDSPALLISYVEQQFDPASIGGSIPHAVATTAIHLRNSAARVLAAARCDRGAAVRGDRRSPCGEDGHLGGARGHARRPRPTDASDGRHLGPGHGPLPVPRTCVDEPARGARQWEG